MIAYGKTYPSKDGVPSSGFSRHQGRTSCRQIPDQTSLVNLPVPDADFRPCRDPRLWGLRERLVGQFLSWVVG